MTKAPRRKGGSEPASLQVDIVSDIVCPWCWLGFRYFQKAVEQSTLEVKLTWRPYMLDPSVPQGGVPYRKYMTTKFGDGPSDRFKAMREALELAAPGAGINFRFGDIPMRPNTLDAHRVMRWAEGQDAATQTAEALFKAFFDDLEDIGDPAVLSRIAGGVGLDQTLISDLLAGDDDCAAVEEEITFFQRLGVTGVPCFIYAGQFAVQGAQPPETHLAAIEKAASLPNTPNGP